MYTKLPASREMLARGHFFHRWQLSHFRGLALSNNFPTDF